MFLQYMCIYVCFHFLTLGFIGFCGVLIIGFWDLWFKI